MVSAYGPCLGERKTHHYRHLPAGPIQAKPFYKTTMLAGWEVLGPACGRSHNAMLLRFGVRERGAGRFELGGLPTVWTADADMARCLPTLIITCSTSELERTNCAYVFALVAQTLAEMLRISHRGSRHRHRSHSHPQPLAVKQTSTDVAHYARQL